MSVLCAWAGVDEGSSAAVFLSIGARGAVVVIMALMALSLGGEEETGPSAGREERREGKAVCSPASREV